MGAAENLSLREVASRLERLHKDRKNKIDITTLWAALSDGTLTACLRLPSGQRLSMPVPAHFWQSLDRKEAVRIVKGRRQIKFEDIVHVYVDYVHREVSLIADANRQHERIRAEFDAIALMLQSSFQPHITVEEWQRYIADSGFDDPIEGVKRGRPQNPAWKEIAEILGSEMYIAGTKNTEIQIAAMSAKILDLATKYLPKISTLPSESGVKALVGEIVHQIEKKKSKT